MDASSHHGCTSKAAAGRFHYGKEMTLMQPLAMEFWQGIFILIPPIQTENHSDSYISGNVPAPLILCRDLVGRRID
ncbi:hypothetical protein AD946_02450 [Gluconobacter thailandicus]|nr:hypothetical protein AD946_02450 [Gluconobacter thailandicus]